MLDPLRFSRAPLWFARSARRPCSTSSPAQTGRRGPLPLRLGDGRCGADDDELPFLHGHAPISKLHREPALVDQEEFVLVLVLVPDERAVELDELHVLSVQLTHDLRVPMGSEQRELLRQADLIHWSSRRACERPQAALPAPSDRNPVTQSVTC